MKTFAAPTDAGVVAMASPMLQEVLCGHLIGVDPPCGALDGAQLAAIASVAAGFTALLSASVPGGAELGSVLLFVAALCVVVSMDGGAFATVPAYRANRFGTQMVGAIHGRLLTAPATAGILGPVVVNYLREHSLGLGIARQRVDNQTPLILAGMLVVGRAGNRLVRPLAWCVYKTSVNVAAFFH